MNRPIGEGDTHRDLIKMVSARLQVMSEYIHMLAYNSPVVYGILLNVGFSLEY